MKFYPLLFVVGAVSTCFISHAQDEIQLSDSVPGMTDLTGEQRELFNKLLEGFEFQNFDPNQENLPAEYKGNSPLAVATALAAELKPKGEFETTVEFQKRIAAFQSGTVYGNAKTSALFSFVVDTKSVYNANSQTMELSIPLIDDFISKRVYIRMGDYLNRENYKAENNFGKITIATKVRGAMVSINFLNTKEFKLRRPNVSEPSNVLSLRVPFPIEEAKTQKDKIRALIISSLGQPYISSEHRLNSPTISLPYDTDFREYFVGSKVREIWFFNQNSGEIYGKIKPSK